MSSFKELVHIFLIFIFINPQTAYAYIDPGTISLIVSAIVAALASIGYYSRIIINKIKNFFSKNKLEK